MTSGRTGREGSLHLRGVLVDSIVAGSRRRLSFGIEPVLWWRCRLRVGEDVGGSNWLAGLLPCIKLAVVFLGFIEFLPVVCLDCWLAVPFGDSGASSPALDACVDLRFAWRWRRFCSAAFSEMFDGSSLRRLLPEKKKRKENRLEKKEKKDRCTQSRDKSSNSTKASFTLCCNYSCFPSMLPSQSIHAAF